MKRNAAVCLCLLLPADPALSQNVHETRILVLNDSTDSASTTAIDSFNDTWTFGGGTPLIPYVFDISTEIEEPIRPPFSQPGFHRSSSMGQFESIGDIWTGSARYSVEYPDTLDLGTSVGDPAISSGSGALVSHIVKFGLEHPTSVVLDATFRTDLNEPYNPSFLNGFSASISLDGTRLLETNFDGQASGIDQSYSNAILLEPGAYEFRTFNLLSAYEEQGYQSASASFDYSLTFVPAPASAMTLGVGLLAIRRKRL